ncbi:cytochrome P450 2G1 isoform X2 [Anolis carolinensis]|uniref:cytochrome P450 2G1 isoform X2 n=1 Tax=Anolis carolinensis TaxID=28377 RepID=UPI002F2B58DE
MLCRFRIASSIAQCLTVAFLLLLLTSGFGMEPLGTSTVLLVICISCLPLSAFWKSQANKRKMPPGPPPLPIIRKALRLKTNHLDLTLCKASATAPISSTELYDRQGDYSVERTWIVSGVGPDGPWGLFQFYDSMMCLFALSLSLQLSKSYGPIFTLYFGPRPVVVLHGYGAVKEALIERADEFAARGRMPSMEKYFQGKVAHKDC